MFFFAEMISSGERSSEKGVQE
jgi:HD domain